MKVVWVGGPLDGAQDATENMPPLQNLWFGPDIAHPHDRVIVYGLYTSKGILRREYRYEPELTAKANERLAELKALRLEEAGGERGGQEDGTGDRREDLARDRRSGGTPGSGES